MTDTPGILRRGGQTKVSLPRLQDFIRYVNGGLTLGKAARAVGISEPTRANWMRRGRLELVHLLDQGIDPTDLFNTSERGWPTEADWTQIPPGANVYEWPFLIFAIAVEKALATFEARNVAIVQRAASGDVAAGIAPTWQAAAWLLERRFPAEYGRAEARLKREVDVTVRPGAEEPLSVEDLNARLLELDEADADRERS